MPLVLENSLELTFEYDQEDDTLYAWVGARPQEAVTYETDDGHLIRLDPETKEFVGVTIFDFEARWADREIRLHWESEVEEQIPWIPWIARKRRQHRAEQRVLRPSSIRVHA